MFLQTRQFHLITELHWLPVNVVKTRYVKPWLVINFAEHTEHMELPKIGKRSEKVKNNLPETITSGLLRNKMPQVTVSADKISSIYVSFL